MGRVRMSLGNWVGIRLKGTLSPVAVTFDSAHKRKPAELELLELRVCQCGVRTPGRDCGQVG